MTTVIVATVALLLLVIFVYVLFSGLLRTFR